MKSGYRNHKIAQLALNGDLIEIFDSVKIAAENLKISKFEIYECLKGYKVHKNKVYRRNQAHGFRFDAVHIEDLN